MATVLITGINGFVGEHLARELSTRNFKVLGIGREKTVNSEIEGTVSSYYACDLTDEALVGELPLEDIDAVISLAGLANVGASFDNPDLYNEVNVKVLSVLANKLVTIGSSARIIAVSTGAVYSADQSMPLTEESELITTGSPYALSKIAMEQEVLRFRQRGLECVIARPFNHIGPGQAPGFLVPDLYRKIAEASKTDGKLRVGDLSTRRDYTDVRDVVRAYADLAMADQLSHAIYNVCSGQSVDGGTILNLMLAAAAQKHKLTIEQDASLIRPHDPKDLYGSNARLYAQTGWEPIIPIEQTIHDFVKNT